MFVWVVLNQTDWHARSSKPKRNASAVVVKDVTELMRTSAALDSELPTHSFNSLLPTSRSV